MKSALASLGLAMALAATAAAAITRKAAVRLNVAHINVLDVSSGGTIMLTATAGSDVLKETEDQTALLNLSHNDTNPIKVTAQVKRKDNPRGHDITLKVAAAGGVGARTLLLGGVGQGVQDIFVGVPAGTLTNRALTYTVSCTASGTPLTKTTSFLFTITFTTTN